MHQSLKTWIYGPVVKVTDLGGAHTQFLREQLPFISAFNIETEHPNTEYNAILITMDS